MERDCCDGEGLLRWGGVVMGERLFWWGRAYCSRENVVAVGSVSQYSA